MFTIFCANDVRTVRVCTDNGRTHAHTHTHTRTHTRCNPSLYHTHGAHASIKSHRKTSVYEQPQYQIEINFYIVYMNIDKTYPASFVQGTHMLQ